MPPLIQNTAVSDVTTLRAVYSTLLATIIGATQHQLMKQHKFKTTQTLDYAAVQLALDSGATGQIGRYGYPTVIH